MLRAVRRCVDDPAAFAAAHGRSRRGRGTVAPRPRSGEQAGAPVGIPAQHSYHARVNLLLLEPGELDGGVARLGGRRARHVHAVLRAAVGQELAAGVVDGPLGRARIERSTADELVVTVRLDRSAPPADDALLLAVPRPKVLLRMFAHAAALGFGRIVLFRSWRVEKSHLASTAMRPAVQREQLLLGLEQAGRTRLPRVDCFPLFKPMVEDALDGLRLPALRFVAHPHAPVATS
ncbi:MAG: hypothetical protein FJ265_16660, partial [Planctomycetes bacterium]|nr:hypothetical protein [Planctomycetota bacterium]